MPNYKFRSTALSAGIAAALGVVPPALVADDEIIEEVIVTGSHIRRSSFEGTKPIQIIDQETIKRIGASQTVDVLKEFSVNSGSQFYNETNNRAGTAMFNIRNLGLGSTLTLVNGKRAGIAAVADDSGTDYLDINQFPISMIERIEVLTDGASATYGSQAVAGVANIITRKGFEGFELSGGFSSSEIEQRDISIAAGSRFDNGSFNFYATYYDQDDAFRSDFDWLNDRLNPSDATSRFLSSTGSPGTYRRATLVNGEASPVAGARRIVDPNCEAAGGVLRSPTDTRCRYLFVDQVSIISAEERVQVFSEFEWEFNADLRYYAEASYSNNLIERGSGGNTFNTGTAVGGGFTIPASHPFNFFTADPDDATDVIYVGPAAWDNTVHTAVDLQATARPLGREVNNTDLTQYIERELQYVRLMQGLEYNINGNWRVDASFGWAEATRTTNAPHNYRSDIFQDLVKSGEWNPFGSRLATPDLVSPKDGTSVAGSSDITLKRFDVDTSSNARVLERVFDIVASGDLFEMNGNMIQAAFGYQHRDVDIDIFEDSLYAAGESNEASLSGTVRGGQSVSAVFGEVVVPVGDTLELQLAVRREDYGGSIGDTTDPKIAFEWRPLDWLGFRGSWGTSFQAPTVRQTASATSSGFIDDPASPTGPGGSLQCVSAGLNNNIVIAVQGAPDLAPQESDNYNLGIVFQFENGVDLSVDYFDFDYTNLIAQSETAQAIVNNDCADDGLPNDPRVIRDAGGQLRQVNTEFVNIGEVATSGFDTNFRYSLEMDNSTLLLDAAATYVTDFDVSNDGVTFDGAGSRNFSNNFSTLPELRGHIGATYLMGDHTLTGKFRYIDEYTNDQSNDGVVESWEVFDLQYSYTLSGLIGDGDSNIVIGVNNVFDEDPPRLTRLDGDGNEIPALNANGGGFIANGVSDRPGYDSRSGHDLRGRIVYVKFTQDL